MFFCGSFLDSLCFGTISCPLPFLSLSVLRVDTVNCSCRTTHAGLDGEMTPQQPILNSIPTGSGRGKRRRAY